MWKQLFIGRPLKLNRANQQTVSKKEALALLSSDALSSVAYGPEQIIIVLTMAVALHSAYTLPVAGLILALLFLLVIAYRSVIAQFPEGGGAYKVTQKYLNQYVALSTAGLLLVDYILTIAVSVSAGVDAFTSAFPSLHSYRIIMSIVFIAALLLLNLRGVSETARVLMFPVYGFIAAIFLVFIMAIFKWNDAAILSPPTIEAFSWMLLVKAFAVGCSALTGVEAISNAVPNFKQPAVQNAQKTMLVLATLLTVLFSGILLLATHFQLTPSSSETILSQLASHVIGRGGLYYFIQAVTICILLLAANTSFAAFPQLLANLARDGYAPRIFLNRGDRLGYSNSMIALSLMAIVCIVVFQGNTEQLIPLYAVGVFVPFSCALLGLVIGSWKTMRMIVPLLAMLLTVTVVVTLAVTKWMIIWPIVLFVPAIVYGCMRIKRHYDVVSEALSATTEFPQYAGQIMIIPVSGIHETTQKALSIAALQHCSAVYALYVGQSQEQVEDMERAWANFAPDIRLITFVSNDQHLLKPILRAIKKLHALATKQHYHVIVAVPQLVTTKKQHALLHNHHAFMLKQALLDYPDISVLTIPFRVTR